MLRQNKSRRWYGFVLAFFGLMVLAPSLLASQSASADTTVTLYDYWRVKTVITVKNCSSAPASDAITGNQSLTANKVSCSGTTATYQTGTQSDSHSGTVPPGTYNECSTLANKCGNISGTANQSNPSTLTLSGSLSTTGTGTTTGAGNGGTQTANATGTSCGGGSFDWLICPTDNLFQKLANDLMAFMQSLLYINTSGSSGIFGNNANGTAYYQAWNTFRILGTALIVIAGLVMVSAQAFGFEFLDAYTIRKVLPRLFIAIVGMSLSWPLLNFVINFFNIVGQDLQQLMYAPFSQLPNHAQLSDGIISWGFVTVVAALLATGAGTVLLPILGTGALALLIAILVLIVRQIGVTILVIMAPFAIAAYVLPNTKKIWDIWKDNFMGLMLMYPIIMALIAAGEIFGAVGKGGSTAQQIVGIVAFFVPYFMIPLAFRMATGFISQISGMVNERSKGAFGALRNARNNTAKKRWGALRSYNRFKGGTEDNFRGRVNRALGRASNINQAGWNPKNMKGNMQRYERTHHNAEAAEFREKNPEFGMFSGDENAVYAALAAKGDDAKMKRILMNRFGYDEGLANQLVGQVRGARQGVSSEVFDRALVMALPASGTGLKEREERVVDAEGYMLDKQGRRTNDRSQQNKIHVMGGNGELNELIDEVWGDDQVGAAQAKVIGRGLAGQARRFDVNGNSTGTDLGMQAAQRNYARNIRDDSAKIKKLDADGQAIKVLDANGQVMKNANGEDVVEMEWATADAVTKATVRGSLNGQGGNYVVGARNAAVKAFVPEMENSIEERVTADNDDTLAVELAKLNGRYESAKSVAPENAQELGKLMGKQLKVVQEGLSATDPAVRQKFMKYAKTKRVEKPVLDSDNKPVIKNGKPEMKWETEFDVDANNNLQAKTVREMMEDAKSNPKFLDVSYQYGMMGRDAALQAEWAAQQGAAAAQVAPPPGGAGPNPGPG